MRDRLYRRGSGGAAPCRRPPGLRPRANAGEGPSARRQRNRAGRRCPGRSRDPQGGRPGRGCGDQRGQCRRLDGRACARRGSRRIGKAAPSHQRYERRGGPALGERSDVVFTEDMLLQTLPERLLRVEVERSVLGAAGRGVRSLVIRPALLYGRGPGSTRTATSFRSSRVLPSPAAGRRMSAVGSMFGRTSTSTIWPSYISHPRGRSAGLAVLRRERRGVLARWRLALPGPSGSQASRRRCRLRRRSAYSASERSRASAL